MSLKNILLTFYHFSELKRSCPNDLTWLKRCRCFRYVDNRNILKYMFRYDREVSNVLRCHIRFLKFKDDRIIILGDNAYKLLRISFIDRKSTRLNSSHVAISYAVFCLKKKKQINIYKQ